MLKPIFTGLTLTLCVALTGCSEPTVKTVEPQKPAAKVTVAPALYEEEIAALKALQTEGYRVQNEALSNMESVQVGIDKFMAGEVTREGYMKLGLPFLRKNCTLFKQYLPTTRKALESKEWPEMIRARVSERIQTYKNLEWGIARCGQGDFDPTYQALTQVPLDSSIFSFNDEISMLEAAS